MARIALEARSLSTLGGGVRTYTLEVIRRLPRVGAAHDYHVFYDASKYRGIFGGVTEHVVPVGHPLLRLAWDFFLLPPALKAARVDLVHYFKSAVSPWGRQPSVATVHDIIPLLFPQTQMRVQRWYWEIQLPLVARTCTHLITTSENSKRDIVERLQVPPERITVTLPGVDERFHPATVEASATVRRAYALPEQFVLVLGTIEPRKNIARLLRAFARVSVHVPHHLVLAGKWGWKYEDVQAALKDPRLRGRVHVLSYVPSEHLPALMSSADAFVFPSLYEGFGLPPLEAMACGTPVVTSSVSSVPEAVGPHALTVHPEDEDALAGAVERLVTDRVLHDRLARDGIAWARQFTWDRTAAQTLTVYEQLLH